MMVLLERFSALFCFLSWINASLTVVPMGSFIAHKKGGVFSRCRVIDTVIICHKPCEHVQQTQRAKMRLFLQKGVQKSVVLGGSLQMKKRR